MLELSPVWARLRCGIGPAFESIGLQVANLLRTLDFNMNCLFYGLGEVLLKAWYRELISALQR